MFIKRDKSDEMFYREFLAESEKLQDVVKEGQGHHYAFEDLSQDIYTMLYEPSPVDETAPTPVGLRIAKQGLDKIKELREYQELHRLTSLDPMAAGFATQAMGKTLMGMLPKVVENPEQLKNKAQVAKELGYDKTAGELEAEADKVQKYLDKIDPRMLDDEAMRQKMRDAMQGALKDTRDALEGMSAYGFDDEPGQLKQSGLKEKMEFAKLIRESQKLKDIAKLAGRFTAIAKKKQQEKMVSSSVQSVKMGDNLARTLPSELAKLANPLLAGMFYKSYFEKTLLEYDLTGKVPQGQGPIIYIMDGSGSMGEGCFAELAAKGIGMALAEIAKMQKRDFILAQFGSSHQYREIQILSNGEVVVEDGKGGHETHPYSPLYVMAELEFFFNGGTNFQRPLEEAVAHIGGHKFNRADIIFATDGCADLTPQFVEQYQALKAEKNFSCIGILIAPGTKDAAGAPEVMRQFCDEIFPVDNLLDDNAENTDLHDSMFKI
jgi:uncharacterized protein with von Willebrand factor type A (vWA) domain